MGTWLHSQRRRSPVIAAETRATGYEVAATSGVPRSAIYNVLKKLEAVGLVNASPGKPTKWMPLPTDRLFQLMEGRFTSSLEGLGRRGENGQSGRPSFFVAGSRLSAHARPRPEPHRRE